VLPGDVIALRSGDTASDSVEWIDRRGGTINATSVDGGATTVLAQLDVSADGEQRGVLGHTPIDGVRYAAWTEPGTDHPVVGALTDASGGSPGTVDRIVWDGGGLREAVGGHLGRSDDGRLVLGIGQRTDWARDHGSGAMVAIDPGGEAGQEPEVLSDGYTNPFAFAVAAGQDDPTLDGALWVADNAVVDDIERIGRRDLDDRDDHSRSDAPPRAPSAVIALPDADLAICGFLDSGLRRWTTADASTVGYGATLGPCITGATIIADGTIVTAASVDGVVAPVALAR